MCSVMGVEWENVGELMASAAFGAKNSALHAPWEGRTRLKLYVPQHTTHDSKHLQDGLLLPGTPIETTRLSLVNRQRR